MLTTKYVKVCPRCGSVGVRLGRGISIIPFKCSSCGFSSTNFPEIKAKDVKKFQKSKTLTGILNTVKKDEHTDLRLYTYTRGVLKVFGVFLIVLSLAMFKSDRTLTIYLLIFAFILLFFAFYRKK